MAGQAALLKVLQELGLSENESAVYLGALGSGPNTMQQLARASGVKRTTIYYVAESLKQKGLLKVEVRGFKKHYVAESPEKLDSMLLARRREFEQALPDLLALYNLKESASFIRYYEGIEGMKSVYDSLLADVRPGDDYLIMSEVERWYNLAPDFFQKFLERRAALDLKIRVLAVDSPRAREYLKSQPRYNWQVKLLPPGTALTTNLVTIPSKVVIHQTVPPVIALEIKNRSVVQLHREQFEIIWNSR